jgi:small subunit ribosomal protein S1
VLEATDQEVIVDVVKKRVAIVPSQDMELLYEDTFKRLVPGKTITVCILQPWDREGRLLVSINLALQQADWVRAAELLQSSEVIEAKVSGSNSGGLLVDFGRLRGFVPNSHVLDLPRRATPQELEDTKTRLIGERFYLKVIEVDHRRKRLVLSQRQARSAVHQMRLNQLDVGQELLGCVSSLTDFGAFVDLGGIDGLIPISELDWCWVDKARDVLSVGDEVAVRVVSLDTKRRRIGLSRKALLPNPWDTIDTHCKAGDLVAGTVTNAMSFGLFVALPYGVIGLVHVSQMQTYNIVNPRDYACKGDQVLVRILTVAPERQRISLSLDAVTYDAYAAWIHENADAE